MIYFPMYRVNKICILPRICLHLAINHACVALAVGIGAAKRRDKVSRDIARNVIFNAEKKDCQTYAERKVIKVITVTLLSLKIDSNFFLK